MDANNVTVPSRRTRIDQLPTGSSLHSHALTCLEQPDPDLLVVASGWVPDPCLVAQPDGPRKQKRNPMMEDGGREVEVEEVDGDAATTAHMMPESEPTLSFTSEAPHGNIEEIPSSDD